MFSDSYNVVHSLKIPLNVFIIVDNVKAFPVLLNGDGPAEGCQNLSALWQADATVLIHAIT